MSVNRVLGGKRGAPGRIPARDGRQCCVGTELPKVLGVSHPMATQSDQSDTYWRHSHFSIGSPLQRR